MCFEILGFDILIDSKCNPWLLEVNQTPSFNIDSPLDEKVKTEVILDAFNIMDVKAKYRK